MAYLAFFIVLVISFYSVLFAFEELAKKNYHGFFAVLFLVISILILPFYLLFLKS
jgi:hypothetical protein